MNILRRYNDDDEMAPPVPKAKVECCSCGSLLEVTRNEVEEDDCGAFHHYPDADSGVLCVVCGRYIPVNSRKLNWER